MNDKATDNYLKRIELIFNAFDKDGNNNIETEELISVFKLIGEDIPEDAAYRMMQEAGARDSGNINFDQFKKIVLQQKENSIRQTEDDTLDAFVSLEGNADGSGHIDAKKLIKIIKEDFEMTIDIEELIKEIDEDNSGEIEFDELKKLLQSGN